MTKYKVEGRYFDDFVQAFTFAQIQADRMDRTVSVEKTEMRWVWASAAHPEGRVAPELKTAPMEVAAASEAA